MALYDTPEGVERYVTMAKGHDGRDLIASLRRFVPDGARVLELGMGPGVDLAMLAASFDAVGSDLSRIFLDRYRAQHPQAELLELDAVTIATQETFDAIYSNKVLHHLTVEEFGRSLERQAEVLRPDGVLLHGLWAGDTCEEHEGMRFQNYTEETLSAVVPPTLELAECSVYGELADDDSLGVVLRGRACASSPAGSR